VVGDRPTHRDLSPHGVALDQGQDGPNTQHMMALLEMAESLSLGYLFTD